MFPMYYYINISAAFSCSRNLSNIIIMYSLCPMFSGMFVVLSAVGCHGE